MLKQRPRSVRPRRRRPSAWSSGRLHASTSTPSASSATPPMAEMLNWLVNEQGIEPHIPVFDKSQHTDGTFSREDFAYDHKRDCYICPAGKELRKRQKVYRVPRPLVDEDGMMRYRASKLDCQGCSLKPQCCPKAPARKIPRSIHEGARDMARDIAKTEAYRTSRCQRKKVEMLFAHLKRILKLDRLRLRGPNGARDEFHLAASAQNRRKLARQADPGAGVDRCDLKRRGAHEHDRDRRFPPPQYFKTDFFNGIGQNRKQAGPNLSVRSAPESGQFLPSEPLLRRKPICRSRRLPSANC